MWTARGETSNMDYVWVRKLYVKYQIHGLKWGMPWYDSKLGNGCSPNFRPSRETQSVPVSMSNLEIIAQLVMTSSCNIIKTGQILSIW